LDLQMIRSGAISLLILACCNIGFALEPNEILVIANSDIAASVRLAKHYCSKRGVPKDNILALSLGTTLNETISRDDYEKKLAEPIRKKLYSSESTGKTWLYPIRCLVTTYGVPFKVDGRGLLKGKEEELKQLQKLKEQAKQTLEQLKQSGASDSSAEMKDTKRKLAQLQPKIDYIIGKETGASVDSELSIVLFGEYELYRWQPNMLKTDMPGLGFQTLMVSRLDGPSFEIAQGLVDKAIAAEQNGLRGVAYIDWRSLADDKKPYSPGQFDQSLRDLVSMIKRQTQMSVVEEDTNELFGLEQCPSAAIYCGWYSLKKYVDAFDFVDGAIGYHISSLEAVDLRDPNSSQWCPAMLADGVTATLGAVAEPYLHSFPEPKAFFAELLAGHCLAEAYYRTKPFNSWQLVLIGDPLYRPFKKP